MESSVSSEISVVVNELIECVSREEEAAFLNEFFIMKNTKTLPDNIILLDNIIEKEQSMKASNHDIEEIDETNNVLPEPKKIPQSAYYVESILNVNKLIQQNIEFSRFSNKLKKTQTAGKQCIDCVISLKNTIDNLCGETKRLSERIEELEKNKDTKRKRSAERRFDGNLSKKKHADIELSENVADREDITNFLFPYQDTPLCNPLEQKVNSRKKSKAKHNRSSNEKFSMPLTTSIPFSMNMKEPDWHNEENRDVTQGSLSCHELDRFIPSEFKMKDRCAFCWTLTHTSDQCREHSTVKEREHIIEVLMLCKFCLLFHNNKNCEKKISSCHYCDSIEHHFALCPSDKHVTQLDNTLGKNKTIAVSEDPITIEID